MEQKLIHGYAVRKLEEWLSLWEDGSLPEEDAGKLDELIVSLKNNETIFQEVISLLPSSAKEILDIYLVLKNLGLNEEESERLDVFVSRLATDERKSMKWRSPRRRWLSRLSVGISAACVLLLSGMYIFLDKELSIWKQGDKMSVVSECDTFESQAQELLAMESVSPSGIMNPIDASEKTAARRSRSDADTSKPGKIKSKKAKIKSDESELERCRRLMREMNLNSNSVSKDALIMLNADFEGSISSKTMVVEMLRELAPKELLKL